MSRARSRDATDAGPEMAAGHRSATESPTNDRGVTGSPVSGAQGAALTSSGPAQTEREFTIAARTQRSLVLRRFLAHRLAVVSLVVFVVVVVSAFVGQRIWAYQYDELTTAYSTPPSTQHPFGTDGSGYDNLALVLRGAQRSVEIALFVALVSTAIGTVYGLIAGFYGGLADSLLMRGVDLVLTLPLIPIAAVLGHNFNGGSNGWLLIAVILALLLWAPIARVVRGVTLSLREKEFIEAARALGASDARIMFRHLLPNTIGPVIVNATIYVSIAILTETALSFIGFGVKAPDTSLGLLVSNAQTAAQTRPWLFYFPGLVIIVIALTINFIGDGLRDALDPQQNRVRA